jgi:hypothetical protein
MTVPIAPGPPPDLAEIRAWLGVSTAQISDHDLDVIRSAELDNQADECRIPSDLAAGGLLPAALIATVYRRCARAVAARGIPLGYRAGDDEFGPVRVSSWDAEITRLEGPRRRFVFG